MAMQHLENEFRKQGKGNLADIIASVATPIETKPSQDQLILPETSLPQEVSDVLQRAKEAGIGVFEVYHLSGVTLSKDSRVGGWDKKPEDWFWKQIRNGKVSQDAATLPDAWVLVDKTPKPDYKDGKQMYENDPLKALLKQLRKDKKIQTIKGIPDTSRFGISHYELFQVILPEIAKVLEVDKNQVRLPKEIEFNVIGNLKHPEWGETNTWEWFEDKFGDDHRLIGGDSDRGGLADVGHRWFGNRSDFVAFRPLVVVSSKI